MASQKGHLQLSFTELPDQQRQCCRWSSEGCQPSVQCVVVLFDDQRLAEQCASVRGFVVSSSDHETILWFKVCPGVFQLFIRGTYRLCPRVANNTLVLFFFPGAVCCVEVKPPTKSQTTPEPDPLLFRGRRHRATTSRQKSLVCKGSQHFSFQFHWSAGFLGSELVSLFVKKSAS